MSRHLRWVVMLVVLGGVVGAAYGTALDDRMAEFRQSVAQTEAQVTGVLEAGVDEGRSAEALAAVQPWLNRNPLNGDKALFVAGQASERAGQWQAAVGYYQRLLQMPNPDGKLAGPATQAVYRLLLNAIGDEGAAYLFMQRDGNRLRPFGNARRYDRWFCVQAQQRRDLIALSDRLAVMVQDKQTPADATAPYLEWLCRELEQFKKETPPVYEAAQHLAEAPGTPPLIKARLKWGATVMPYNQKLDELRDAKTPVPAELTDAPLAAAAQLLKLDPDRATTVAAGWGVEYDHPHSGNCHKRFEVGQKRKLDQLLAVLPRMSPDKRDDLLAYRLAQGRVQFDMASVRQAVIDHPDMLNALTAADVPLFDQTLAVDHAKKLAPHLARNPHGQAALVRAVAASGSLEYGKLAEALFAAEAWRFDAPRPMIELAWRNSPEKEQPYKSVANRHKTLGARHEALRGQVEKKADSKNRMAAFNALHKDLLSDAPSIPGALALWDELFDKAPETDTIAMLKKLAGDLSGDREYLLRRALAHARAGGARMIYWQSRWPDNYLYHGGQRSRYIKAMAPVTADLQRALTQQIRTGAVSPLSFGLWLHAVDPADDQARGVIQALVASPAYAKLPAAYRSAAADAQHFGALALRADELHATAGYVSEALMALPAKPTPQAVEAALADAMQRAAAAPEPVVILGVDRVAAAPQWNDKIRQQVLWLFRDHAPIGAYPTRQGYEPLVQRVVAELRQGQRWAEVEPYVADLWHAAASTDDQRYYRAAAALVAFAEAAADAEAVSLALSVARGAETSRAGQAIARRTDQDLPELTARAKRVAGKAAIALGIIDIPVDPKDPAYPIYKSQSEFASGNTDAAWDLYDKNADQVVPIVRELTVPYCLWLLDQSVARRQSDRAEALIRALTVWSRQAAGAFTAQQDAELKIAYADVAFQNGELQTAKAWYRRVADAREYRGTQLQYKAILRSVDVDRAARDFSSALNELDKLLRVRDDDLRLRVHYARAEVLFDQANYADAFEELSTVLKRDPGHADALILLGKAQLEMRKLVDASEIELGVSRDQKRIVPGETLKINLNDPALNISGVGADIEVEIWTKSGDRERVKLHQVGDDKTKFRAEVPTALAARVPGDKALQVLGRDEIRYGYSKRFRAKMTDLPPDPDIVIGVASDARLSASAGAFAPRQGERRLNLEELGVSTAQQALGTRRVRPGNPVYIRVTDPDQSRTDDVDEVVVSVTASSGDVIRRLVLKETGKHTGEFQAAIPTARAEALAYASESAPGRDANMVISAQDYPGWAGQVGSKAAVQYFTIDLNDNVDLDRLSILCGEPTQGLSHFVVQTSMDGRHWASRARYPGNPEPPSGKPQITAFPTYKHNSLPISEPEDRTVPADWHEKMEIASASGDVAYKAFTVPGLGDLGLDLPSGGHPGYSVLMRYRAMFYQPAAAIRTFRLEGLPPTKGARTIFLIDDKPAEAKSDDPLTITRELGPGLHTIEIWRHESRAELVKRKPKLLCNVEGQDELQPCPDEMFNPAGFPEAVRQTVAGPTSVADAEVTPNTIEVVFGLHTRARLVRLAIVGHRGAAPAISKITLTDRSGGKRLPVATDYQKLRNNEQLEVVPGDSVTVRYEDDQSVTPRRDVLQGRLSVAYNTATISASFLNFEITEEGRLFVPEAIRRFKIDDEVGIVVTDPDMDQTPEEDQITITVQASSGKPVTLPALETGPHTGVFLGRVFPVAGEPTRESEIRIQPGDTLTARYRDEENLSPGIPADRSVVIEHALYRTPRLDVYNMASSALPLAKPDPNAKDDDDERGPEIVQPRWSVTYQYPADDASGQPARQAIIGTALRFDVLASHLAFAASSEVVAYVQTESGRKAQKKKPGDGEAQAFDITVPGTLKLTAKPSRGANVTVPPGYVLGSSGGPPSSRPAIDEGRFAFAIPIVLGDVPTRSFATKQADALRSSQIPDALEVRPGDRIHVAFADLEAGEEPQWLTATIDLHSHAFLDVMDGRYRRAVSTAYVGEKLHVRLISPALDLGPDRDVTTVHLKADSGASVAYELRETEAHSGVFKGAFALGYADKPAGQTLPPVALYGFPVKYGDRVSLASPHTGPDAPPALSVTVNKGADGFIEPFSKRYGEDGVAIQTTFTMAECFFELAKHHREMEQESLARREMGHAQKLLAEAIASHHDPEMQAHAEYLLGNLAQEYADLSKNETSRQMMYQDALARFSKIPLDYADTEFAPKAQFKKALVYEKLKEVDIAVEEYVKLAYKYPDHELIPSVMSRLGAYFQEQGKALKTQAEALEEDTEDLEARGEALKLRDKATKQYLNAAQVFKKLQERFPTDPLAGLAGLRAAQNYMRAGDFKEAIAGFQKVVDTEQYDDKTVRSQALFWMGISHERISDMKEAYEIYRRITFDFPDSVWAKQARGRLADPAFARIIEIENQARERMLEALKEEAKRRR